VEGGNPILEYITYAMVGVVLFALGFLAFRTAKFFLTLLAIPLLEAAARWRPAARSVAAWGERGAERDPTSWRATLAPDVDAQVVTTRDVPIGVRRGVAAGATIGALPGIWYAISGALRDHVAGAPLTDVAATIGIAIGLVAAAGAFVGAAVGVVAGLGVEALRERRR